MRKLTRDIIASGDLVGVYFADTNGEEVLLETSPEKADLIIALWNGEIEPNCEVCGFNENINKICIICNDCAFDRNIRNKY